MHTTDPHVAVVILNYNGRALLEAYLPSVMAINYPNHSVWIIDNASTDDSLAWLHVNYPGIKLISLAANGGFAQGYNEGLVHIKADYYLLLNSDVEVNASFLQPIVAAMESNTAIAFAQPKIRWLRQPEYFEYAGAAGGLIDALGYPFCRGRVFDKLEIDRGQYNDSPFVFWASGACMLARATAFWQLGGFYTYFFMHNEEIDLCWRAQNAGYHILACGQSSVMHLGGASLAKTNPRKTYFNFRNNLVMCMRNMPKMRIVWWLPARIVLDGVAALKMLVQGKPKDCFAIFKAWRHFFSWLFKKSANKWPGQRGMKHHPGYAPVSIVLDHFIRKKI